MSKKGKTPLGIFIESIGLYFSNFDKFVKYMTFPVLGQIFGLSLVFLLVVFYTKHVPFLVEKYSIFNNWNILIFTAIAITLPGLLIFMKSFWEYLVAYGSVNSMLDNMLQSGKVYDFDAHTELIKRRSVQFIGLWILFGIFTFIAIIPLFWVPACVFAIYFVLTFQIFTFEPELSPIECVKKSLNLIKSHFASTFLLISLIGALTYVFVPTIAIKFFVITNLTNFIAHIIQPLIAELPIPELNNFLKVLNAEISVQDVSKFFVETCIIQIFIQYTLPLRAILWSMWYKELNKDVAAGLIIKNSKSKKLKPSENLISKSQKKFSQKNIKRIDKNVLRRAMQKNDDEINNN